LRDLPSCQTSLLLGRRHFHHGKKTLSP
jgi:hypothetical protein